jgi:hypothetical protein
MKLYKKQMASSMKYQQVKAVKVFWEGIKKSPDIIRAKKEW